METLFRLFSCGPIFAAKPEEEGTGSKDVPVPPATKEPVEDQQISADISADTNSAIEAAIEAAGSQVGAADAASPPASVEIRTQSFETPEEEQGILASTPPSSSAVTRTSDTITASLD